MQHCCLHCLLGKCHPKTVVIAAVSGVVAEAIGNTAAGSRADPATAAQNTAGTATRAFGVGSWATSVIIYTIPISAPFPYIATHIIQA
tara:strand:- start:1832 stop:2095 length:264 start_codon:yes stop_codon:yes gene_type:complete